MIFCCYRFAEDGFSFSLNVDDPTVTSTTLSDEFKIVEEKVGVDRLRLLKTVGFNVDIIRSYNSLPDKIREFGTKFLITACPRVQLITNFSYLLL